jgi:carotenoid 1,2-hydratase
MTERGADAVTRSKDTLAIGPSSFSWDEDALTVHINELATPFPRRVRGKIRVEPEAINPHSFLLEARGRHFWRPIAPSARVSLDLLEPYLRWRGRGYFDTNAGAEPLENAFSRWTWLRASLRDGAAILYDAERRRESPLSLALRFDRLGGYESIEPPPPATLPPTGWRVARQTRSDDGQAFVERGFEDTPFYARSLVSASLCGERVAAMHESLSLDRFANPLVRLMLPFRMPRRGQRGQGFYFPS